MSQEAPHAFQPLVSTHALSVPDDVLTSVRRTWTYTSPPVPTVDHCQQQQKQQRQQVQDGLVAASKSLSSSSPQVGSYDKATASTSKPSFPTLKVESVEAWGTSLYMGTHDGHVVHYDLSWGEINTRQFPTGAVSGILYLGQGKKKVEQLIAFPSVDKLVALVGGTVVFVRLSNFALYNASPFKPIKDAMCITHDETIDRADIRKSQFAILSVAKRTRLVAYKITASDLRTKFEVPLSNGAVTICQQGWIYCLADRYTYMVRAIEVGREGGEDEDHHPARRSPAINVNDVPLVEIQQPYRDEQTGEMIFPPRPRVLALHDGNFLFLAASGSDNALGVVTNSAGEPTGATIQFTYYPKSLAYSTPFVYAAAPAGEIEVYRVPVPAHSGGAGGDVGEISLIYTYFSPTLAVDSRECPQYKQKVRKLCQVAGGQLHDPAVQLLADDEFGNLKPVDDPRRVKRSGFFFNPISSHGSFSIAVAGHDIIASVIAEAPLTEFDRKLDTLVADQILGLVDEATATEPDVLLYQAEAAYLQQRAGLVLLQKCLLDDALQVFRRGSLDPRILLHLYPEVARYVEPYLVPLSRLPLPRKLRDQVASISSIDALIGEGARQFAGEGADSDQIKALQEMLSVNATEMLTRYLEFAKAEILASTSHSHHWSHSEQLRHLVDTSLLILYTKTHQDDEVWEMLEMPNDADLELAVKYMFDSYHYYTASITRKSQGRIGDMLDIWQRILLGEWQDQHFGGIEQYLDFVTSLEPQDPLFLRCFNWLFEHDVDAAMSRLFGALPPAALAEIDVQDVFLRLEEKGDDDSLLSFIERLAESNHPKAGNYEGHLLKLYMRRITDICLQESTGKSDVAAVSYSPPRSLQAQFRDHFALAQLGTPSLTFRRYLELNPDSLGGTLGRCLALRHRLVDRLCDKSARFDAGEFLDYINTTLSSKGDQLGLERAILLVRKGDIQAAIDTLIHDVCDYVEAELLILHPDSPESLGWLAPMQQDMADGRIFSEKLSDLLAVYIALPNEDTAYGLVRNLVNRYNQHFDARDVVSRVPDHWLVAVVEPFLRHKFSDATRECNSSDIVRSIYQSRNTQIRESWIEYVQRAGPILVKASQTCAACHKLLGSDMFAILPRSKDIYHINCVKQVVGAQDPLSNYSHSPSSALL